MNASISQMMSLDGRLALVVGVGGQFGTRIVEYLLELGADVVGLSRSQSSIDAAATIRAQGNSTGRFIGGVTCDITSPSAIDAAFQELPTVLAGRVPTHLIINSGGVEAVIKATETFDQMDINRFNVAMDLNFTGPVMVAQKAIQLMDAASNPFLGIVCSMSTEGHLSRVLPYRCAKAASEQLLSFLTIELMKKSKDWTVIGWRPGFVPAEQSKAVMDSVRKDAIIDHMPRGEWQTAEEIARVIVLTCTDAFRPCHGAVIDIAAGFPHAGLGMKAL